MFNRSEVKAKGKESFKKFYWPSVVAALVLGACSSSGSSSSGRAASNEAGGTNELVDAILSNPAVIAAIVGAILVAIIIGYIVKFAVLNNIIVGCRKFFVDIQHGESKLGTMVSTFKSGKYGNVTITMLCVDIFTALWTMLFIIPGIIKAYEYRMIPYILADDPSVDRKEAFRRSKEMMMGNKMSAFVYDLSFLGWIILSVFTCGILAVFYVAPYKASADAVLYETLKGDATPDIVSSVEY